MSTNASTARKSARPVKASPADLFQDKNVALAAGVERIADPRLDTKPGKDEKIGDSFVYLATKPASDLHEDMADWILRVTGLQIPADQAATFVKAVQLTAVLRHDYQKSNWNQTREAFRGVEPEVCEKRSEHMILAHQEARAILEAKEAKAKADAEAAAKKTAAPQRRTPKATPATVAKATAPKAKAS